ncbi:hypothetical protein E4U42_002060 [Claviceps africana]|uniref:Vacuolar iron transporter Ccc1 n=1 Tax=Claviceps africana TaxID=83212 RepID=A0A8K0J8I9_9HYPO|nr:hypothetical protein E4U42_002060 [Claviceps africana]
MPSKSPSLTRFLSDFTLGFSDGRTVPFGLTAGLSSLGQTDTVVYAGLAELCAGSISMGIGGYLSARDGRSGGDDDGSDDEEGEEEEEEERGMLRRRDSAGHGRQRSGSRWRCSSAASTRGGMDADEKDQTRQARHEAIIRRHLAALALPEHTTLGILTFLGSRREGLQGAALRVRKHGLRESVAGGPVVSGLSISLGYIVGGIIPLLPYLFAPTVGQGLRWSTVACLFALMAFGFAKSWLLGGERPSWRTSLCEGAQMLVLGAFAAAAAVLCVNLLGRASQTEESG